MASGSVSAWQKGIGLLFFAILFSSACTKEKKPSHLLSHDQMVNALAKIYISEQKIHKLSLGTDSSLKVFQKMKPLIFKDVGVPDSVFKKSYDYYMDKPQELEQIYAALIDTLNLYEQRLNIVQPTSPRKNPR